MPVNGRILVIDDEPGVRGRLALWLSKNGYSCVFVGSTEEADAILRSGRFDAVVYTHEFVFPSEAGCSTSPAR